MTKFAFRPDLVQKIGIRRDPEPNRYDIHRLTVNGHVMGDSRGYSKSEAIAEAHRWHHRDPEYNLLDHENLK